MVSSGAAIDVKLLQGPVQYVPIDPFPVEAGGEAVFLGRTREEFDSSHGKLVRLSYEAYESMAQTMLAELAQTAATLFDCLVVRVHHAIGDVALGEASVFVQTACGHRGAAFDSCRYLIDGLKRHAPIWKREIWEDGASWSPGVAVTAERGF